MEPGTIVEFIDRQKIICGVVQEVNHKRLHLITEADREVTLSPARLTPSPGPFINLNHGREETIGTIKKIISRRKALAGDIRVREIWEVINTEEEWIDVPTMAGLVFSETISVDHESAVIRSFFNNRRYFKYGRDGFFPYTPEQVEAKIAREKKLAHQEKLVNTGVDLLRQTMAAEPAGRARPEFSDLQLESINILKSYCIYEKESETYDPAKRMARTAGLEGPNALFRVLAKLGIFSEDENLDLPRFDIAVEFPEEVLGAVDARPSGDDVTADERRMDLTEEHTMTIDGPSTLDFDDAVSVSANDDLIRVGIHIADVAHYIPRDDPIDQAARRRGTSMYMPDLKIPMLPPELSEKKCSLIKGEVRPTISTLVTMDRSGRIVDYEVTPSIIRVRDQLTYFHVNHVVDENTRIKLLSQIADNFRKYRMANSAIHINLPELSIWITEDGTVNVNRINRESLSRMLVAELMVMGNWLMARFLVEKGLPAVFRSQPEPKKRLYEGEDDNLFQNYMQRKQLSRFLLGSAPEYHVGLGLDAYVTATSPIRKYFDLITQRQIRAAFGMETPYTADEIDRCIQVVEEPIRCVGRIQSGRNRYFLLKHLEGRVGERLEAMVLFKRRRGCQIVIPEFMIECHLADSERMNLYPEDMIRVTLKRVSARDDMVSVLLN